MYKFLNFFFFFLSVLMDCIIFQDVNNLTLNSTDNIESKKFIVLWRSYIPFIYYRLVLLLNIDVYYLLFRTYLCSISARFLE